MTPVQSVGNLIDLSTPAPTLSIERELGISLGSPPTHPIASLTPKASTLDIFDPLATFSSKSASGSQHDLTHVSSPAPAVHVAKTSPEASQKSTPKGQGANIPGNDRFNPAINDYVRVRCVAIIVACCV